MRRIIYYVASSIDGYISGPEEDIRMFVSGGNGVEKYLSDLKEFDTVIMGRKTYEFGYRFGLIPGQPAYLHMQHFIFSDSLKFDHAHPQVKICPVKIEEVTAIKKISGADIYLCGGGTFAGWLLDHNLIDEVRIKLNPIVLGAGTRIFGSSSKACSFRLENSTPFDNGLQIMTFRIT